MSNPSSTAANDRLIAARLTEMATVNEAQIFLSFSRWDKSWSASFNIEAGKLNKDLEIRIRCEGKTPGEVVSTLYQRWSDLYRKVPELAPSLLIAPSSVTAEPAFLGEVDDEIEGGR